MNIVYHVSKSRLPNFEENMMDQQTAANTLSLESIPNVKSLLSTTSSVKNFDGTHSPSHKIKCFDPWMLRF